MNVSSKLAPQWVVKNGSTSVIRFGMMIPRGVFRNNGKLYRIIYIWVNYNDLTATSLESSLIREIIPKWP